MNKGKLNKVIAEGNIVIPLYILKCFKKLNLTMEEFIFLMYIYNKQAKVDFNPEKIAFDLNIDIMEVMGYIAVLTDKGYITLDVIKGNDNIIEEVINLDNFYEKISLFLISEEEKKEKPVDNLLTYVETQLSRPLNSLEIETIKSWQENNLDDSLIKEAIKIALSDGVYSLKYIDKILVDFKSRGYKYATDIQNNSSKEKKENLDSNVEIFDWNWLDDDEEYIIN